MDEGGRSCSIGSGRSRRPRFFVVPVGIALFAVGFVVTLAALSGVGAAGDARSEDGFGMLLFGGIAASLAGVVAAAAGPTSLLLSRKDRGV